MGQPATRSPDAHRPSNRRVASSRLSFPEFLLPLPFPSPSQLGLSYWLGSFGLTPSLICVVPKGTLVFLFRLPRTYVLGYLSSVPAGLVHRCYPVSFPSQHSRFCRRPRDRRLFMLFPERLDLHIDSSGKIKLHQRIYRLRRRIENVQQALVRADLELLARLLVHVRRTQHRVLVLHRRQRNRPSDLSARALRGCHDFRRGLIQHAVIVCLQPDAYFFVSYHVFFPDPFRLIRKERS